MSLKKIRPRSRKHSIHQKRGNQLMKRYSHSRLEEWLNYNYTEEWQEEILDALTQISSYYQTQSDIDTQINLWLSDIDRDDHDPDNSRSQFLVSILGWQKTTLNELGIFPSSRLEIQNIILFNRILEMTNNVLTTSLYYEVNKLLELGNDNREIVGMLAQLLSKRYVGDIVTDTLTYIERIQSSLLLNIRNIIKERAEKAEDEEDQQLVEKSQKYRDTIQYILAIIENDLSILDMKNEWINQVQVQCRSLVLNGIDFTTSPLTLAENAKTFALKISEVFPEYVRLTYQGKIYGSALAAYYCACRELGYTQLDELRLSILKYDFMDMKTLYKPEYAHVAIQRFEKYTGGR